MQKNTKRSEKDQRKVKFIEDLVSEVNEDFILRQKNRLELEKQWQLNVNFLAGNQYGVGEVNYARNTDDFTWNEKGVYNHIAPVIESRLARLSKLKTDLSVMSRSEDDTDVKGAESAEKALKALFSKESTIDAIKKTNLWSETCGTGFYKIIWDNDGGELVGVSDGKEVKQGDVKIISISPFEIFPDNLFCERIEDCASIIHARAVSVKEVKEKYGVTLVGKDLDVYGTNESGKVATKKSGAGILKNAVMVIEKYERPTAEFKNGRLITVAGDELLYYGDLPYKVGDNKTYGYPFIKQECIARTGSFFGASIIERLIPVQRAYNAVKNRKHEFLNRIANGVLKVEDGSIDIDDLESEGLRPGKILVYRQGAKEPEMLTPLSMPTDFNDEENKLLSEFVTISGVSDVSSSSNNAGLSSGSALQLLIEQDNQRLYATAEIIRNSFLKIAKYSLRLYSQFLAGIMVVKFSDEHDKKRVAYLDKSAVNSDEVYYERENQMFYSEELRRETVLKLLECGLLSDEDGEIRQIVKEKVLEVLGYSDLASQKGISILQEEKAKNENKIIREKGASIEEIDDDEIHIDEHLRYVFAEYDELSAEEKERLFSHIKEHKERRKLNKEEKTNGKNT